MLQAFQVAKFSFLLGQDRHRKEHGQHDKKFEVELHYTLVDHCTVVKIDVFDVSQ